MAASMKMTTSVIKATALIALMMEAVSISETQANFYETTRRNIPEYRHLPIFRFATKLHISYHVFSLLMILKTFIRRTNYVSPHNIFTCFVISVRNSRHYDNLTRTAIPSAEFILACRQEPYAKYLCILCVYGLNLLSH
jgi:hypothetical protein